MDRDDRPLAGFTVGVAEGPGQWEQLRLLRALGARAVAGFATAAEADQSDDRRAAAALVRAAAAGAVDAVAFPGPAGVRALFEEAAAAGREGHLRWALNGHVLASGAAAAAAVLRSAGVVAPLEIPGERPRAVVAAVATALGRRVAVLPASHPVEVRGRMVRAAGASASVELTGRERIVLTALARRAGVVSKEALLREGWAPGGAGPHAVEVTVARLRVKVGPLGLDVRNARRRGYWLACARPGTVGENDGDGAGSRSAAGDGLRRRPPRRP